MGGTREGGLKSAAKVKQRYGKDFYRDIGRAGGLRQVPKGFAANPELAREAGRKGGLASRRGPAKKTKQVNEGEPNGN
jgi:general stress protein YciG